MSKKYFVYIMMSKQGTLYIGVTNNLLRRVYYHKSGLNKKSFTEKYNCIYLVYFEDYKYIDKAIAREKQLKKWIRKKKLNLIKTLNPKFDDLFI